jgi:hypothetical protein
MFYSSLTEAQSKRTIGFSAGILHLNGTTLGTSVLFENKIDDNLEFIVTGGIYFWDKSGDFNSSYYAEPVEKHVKEFANWIIPARVGLKYNFGKTPSHPFASIEWGLNYINEDLQYPFFNTNTGTQIIDYKITNRKMLYASFGFAMGYTFNLSSAWNLDIGIVSHTGSKWQYINFISAVKYSI